jgi:hypothetical protein
MALIIEAPNDVFSIENHHNIKVFLAGGITNCPDWQAELIGKIKDINEITVYNPRRSNFPIDDPNASIEQITWEYEKLSESDLIIFWFSKGSLNPIVLYELGRWGNSQNTPIIIGIDPGYERTQDVEIQTALSRPDTEFVSSIDEMTEAIKRYLD